MFKHWFTAPKNKGFSSFYFYDSITKEFCRIRLELKRASPGRDDGRTAAFYSPYRVVGFSTNAKLDFRNRQWWSILKKESGDRLLYQGHLLLNSDPEPGEIYVYDSADTLRSIHKGSPRIPAADVLLPPGITVENLLKLAKVTLARKKNIYLTSKYATPEHLANKILAEINFPLMICDVVAQI